MPRNYRRATAPPPKTSKMLTPMEVREKEKDNSFDAKWTRKNGAQYHPMVYLTNGTMAPQMDAQLRHVFGHAVDRRQYTDPAIQSAYQLASQAIVATIVNGHAKAVIKNQQVAMRSIGRGEQELGWWTTPVANDVETLRFDENFISGRVGENYLGEFERHSEDDDSDADDAAGE